MSLVVAPAPSYDPWSWLLWGPLLGYMRLLHEMARSLTREPVAEQVTVVGCLCTPLDLLGDNVTLPRADVGDLIVLYQAGAYGLTASPTAFLSHPAPAEVLV